MLKGKTKSGFEFEIDEKLMDDMEVLEAIAKVEEGDVFFPAMITKILGEKQKNAFYDHIRTKKGTVPIAKAVELFTEIMDSAGDKTKNS